MGLRTIHLKIHNPSTLKRKIIDTAFINYNNAFNYLLKKAYKEIDIIQQEYKSPKGNYSTLSVSKWIDKESLAYINRFDIQPFKDSLKLDFGMTLTNYFTQKKVNSQVAFPGIKPGGTETTEKLRPIYFCRYDTKRSFCFLYDEANDKFFAKLYIMNNKNAYKRTDLIVSRKLKCVSKNKEEAKCLKKETYIIVPLSFGKFQENILKQALDKPEILRTAHLIRKGNEYYINLSINLPEDEKVETETFLGVSRGIENAINYSISNSSGKILDSGNIEYQSLTNTLDEKTKICILANKIVDLAFKYKSKVILQNLVGKGDKLSWSENGLTHKPLFGCRLYNEFARVVEYKLPQKGLPVPAKVSSVDIFHKCSLCGNNTKKNRFSKTIFICTACGLSYNIDKLGSINLATKLITYENTPFKLKAKKTYDGMYLQNELIGLDLFVSKNEDPFDRLKDEIKEISSRAELGTNDYKLNSKDINILIGKLVKQNFTNIQIV